MTIESVYDLSIEVHLLKKKHNIEEFYDNINKLLGDAGIEPIEAASPKSTLTLEDRITINYGKMIANTLDRDEVTLDDLDDYCKSSEFDNYTQKQESILKEVWDMSKEYSYTEFVNKCNSLRKEFFEERIDYLSTQFMSGPMGVMSLVFAQTRVPEVLLGEWIRSTLRKEEGPVPVKYEDLNGEIKEVSLIHTEKTPPEGRIHGQNPCDSFLIDNFFDGENWVEIPVKMIISIENNDLPDIDFGGGGNVLA